MAKCPHCGHDRPVGSDRGISPKERGRLMGAGLLGDRGAARRLIADYHRRKGGGGTT